MTGSVADTLVDIFICDGEVARTDCDTSEEADYTETGVAI